MAEYNKHRRFRVEIYIASIGILLAVIPQAHAEQPAPQPADSTRSSENPDTVIVVTAMKRVGTVQTTPASIAAVGGVQLQARGIASFASLAQGTPGVSLKSEGPSQTEVEMRGLTSSGGNSATVGF